MQMNGTSERLAAMESRENFLCEIFHFLIWFVQNTRLIMINNVRYKKQTTERKSYKKPKLANIQRRNSVRMFNCFAAGGGGVCMLVLSACGLAQSVSVYAK